MDEKVIEIIENEILGKNNKDINENETLEEYLRCFKTNELVRLAIILPFYEEEYYDMYRINSFSNRPKKFIIEYLLENLNKIVETFIKIIGSNELKQLSNYLKSNKDIYDLHNYSFTIHCLDILKRFCLVKLEYNKKDGYMKIYMPTELKKAFKLGLKNNKVLKENKCFNEIFDFVRASLSTYGIISLEKLHKLCIKQIGNIEIDELESILTLKMMIEEFYIYSYNSDKLICNLEFADEDYALDFYENQKMDYKEYSKTELYAISNDTYIESLNSYKTLIKYLGDNFEIGEKDLDYIKTDLVMDYIYMAQTEKEIADANFVKKIKEMFEIDRATTQILLELVQNVYKDYPKWIKRGNI